MTQKTTNPGYKPPQTLKVNESLENVRDEVQSTAFSNRGTVAYRENGFTAEFDGYILQAEETGEEVYIERYEQDLKHSSEESWNKLRHELVEKEPAIASD